MKVGDFAVIVDHDITKISHGFEIGSIVELVTVWEDKGLYGEASKLPPPGKRSYAKFRCTDNNNLFWTHEYNMERLK